MSLQLFTNSSRVWPKRILEGIGQTSVLSKGCKPILGFVNPAELIVKSGSTQLIIFTAGYSMVGESGKSLTLTINTGAGALSVASNGFDITVTLASGGSTCNAVISAVQSQFPAPSPLTGPTNPGYPFVAAALFPGATGSTACPTLSKTNFTSNQRYP